MNDHSSKLDHAAQATDTTQALVANALKRLETAFNGRIVDGYGIYRDPGRQRDALRSSIADLRAALDKITATPWPLDADYDAAEAEGL